MDNRREQFIQIIKQELIGPDPIKKNGLIQENGEEIIVVDTPSQKYISGILYPQNTKIDSESEDTKEYENEYNEEPIKEISNNNFDKKQTELNSYYDENDEVDDLINLSNAYKQSAISITFAANSSINVIVTAARYQKEKYKVDEKDKVRYLRIPIKWTNKQKQLQMPNETNRLVVYYLNNELNGEETKLKFTIAYRYYSAKHECIVYTCGLENTYSYDLGGNKDENSYFQVEFELISDNKFCPLPIEPKVNLNDEDYNNNLLLYRNVKNYAIGHGCAADWVVEEGVNYIKTSFFPEYEMKPIIPNIIEGVTLSMKQMMKEENYDDVYSGLHTLCDKYKQWIDKINYEIGKLDDKYKDTAKKNVSSCLNCHQRMLGGIDLLKNNKIVRRAFQLMNKAMLLQQLHYNMPLRMWHDNGNNELVFSDDDEKIRLPLIEDDTTWYSKDKKVYGMWRPFQLAFILMNLKSMYKKDDDERNIVDLIWFPTGGGKTEAYLGLSAYTIFIRRLLNKDDNGTTILMRYTLRLLTTQQYERASSLICACEHIRSLNEDLGMHPITIGLWVGSSTTPNTIEVARSTLQKVQKGNSANNPFVILKCPWCGAQMGIVKMDKTGPYVRTPGYRYDKDSFFHYKCHNKLCDFSKTSLPLTVIDEQIYNNPPTLLLGTVDKFAVLPFKPESQQLFGIYKNKRTSPPDLIIQDELHLISGPLGSMVGHYETIIDELCTNRSYEKLIKPKIIASTATISKAREQCNALYNKGIDNIQQFPPSGINANDSFFAIENKNKKGRKYIGIYAPGASSQATATIRLYSSILFAASEIEVKQEEDRDPYWTNIGYFNSLRELGRTSTFITADINEYLHSMNIRKGKYNKEIPNQKVRYIYKHEELTSREDSSKINSILQNLNLKYPSDRGVIDICLATNMISVGLDVPRLGLMTICGQPKTTSEYIQTTSRVGRDSENAPGLIFTMYNPSKVRDKSMYEHFRDYHAKIYTYVEPTSVTPFSAPLRSRALHAIFIGLLRLLSDREKNQDPSILPDDETITYIKEIILKRSESVSKEEKKEIDDELNQIIDKWSSWNPQKYGAFSNKESSTPLMYSSSIVPNKLWYKRGFPTPTSMRNVDKESKLKIIDKYISKDDNL